MGISVPCSDQIPKRWESREYAVYSCLTSGRQTTNTKIVTCSFLILPLSFDIGGKVTEFKFSSFKYHFQRLLECDHAATAIAQKDRPFACQLVVLDLLRAASECWMVFLFQIFRKSKVHTTEMDTRSRLYNISAFKVLSKATRDLDLAIQYTLGVAMLPLEDQDIVVKSELRSIEVEINAKTQCMKNKVDNFLASLESVSEVKKTLVGEGQALGVNRLTILAAMFLPLSLSSSLLSMNNRAAALGLLWYDYVGLCSMLIFCVFLAYHYMRIKDILRVTQATITAKTLDRVKQNTRLLWKVLYFWVNFISTSFQSKIELWIWSALRILLYLGFGATVVISFWVAMFKNVSLGLRFLGYGAAGWCFLLAMLFIVQGYVFPQVITGIGMAARLAQSRRRMTAFDD